jgi:cytochrome P450
MFYYIHKYPEIKHKLLEQIRPPVDKVADDIVNGLDYDTVMEFDYLKACWYESLRIEPPVVQSIFTGLNTDTVINAGDGVKVLVKSSDIVSILF